MKNLNEIVQTTKNLVDKNQPAILTGVGITGLLTTTVLAVKATPKVLRNLDEAENEKNGELTFREKIKAGWKPYVPAFITAGASTACIIAAQKVNMSRTTAALTAYKISETALSEYREKVVETIGEKKEQKIRDEINKDRAQRINASEIVFAPKEGTLCLDVISGRQFKCDLDKLRKVENELNKRLMDEMYISLNEFYDAVGLPCTKGGHELGWNLDDGLIDLYFSATITKDDQPCVVIDYAVAPRYGFDKLM